MDNLISIVIPVYNHEQALPKALASIAGQTYKNYEVIVVDDGSNNKSVSPPAGGLTAVSCQLIRQDHGGAPAARNRGFREAKGEYVIFWDADVIAEPEMLEKMIGALAAHPEASYAYSNFYFGCKEMPARPFDPSALKNNNYIHTTALIRRRDLPEKPWDESLKRFQDWDLWLTLLEQKKIGVYVPEYLFRVTPRAGGMSTWLPAFAYRAPWCWLPGIRRFVHEYEEARWLILDKIGR